MEDFAENGRPAGTEQTEVGEKPDTRFALVLAAVKAFSRSGYEGVTLRDIERLAGVNRGLAAYHFKTKAQLWHAALDWLMAEFEREWLRYRDLLMMVSAEERERVMLRIYVHFVAKHPEFFRLLVLEGDGRTDRTRVLADEYLRRLIDFFRRVTDEPQEDPEQAAMELYAFTGAASMIFAAPAQCRFLFGIDPTTDEFVEHFADVIASRGYSWPRLSPGSASESTSDP